jgi:hypothetical protein
MDTIASALVVPPAELRHRRVRLEMGPGAAAHACGHVRAAIAAWQVPVNQAVAILLTSDLVINAMTNGAGDTITLGIRWTTVQFRVEVHDASAPVNDWDTDENADRGLLLAAAMAMDSGHYRTPAGRAVYYVLAPEPQAASAARGDMPPFPPSSTSTVPTEGAASPPPGMDRGLVPRESVSGDGEL